VCAIRAALILAVLSALLLIAARPAQAQTETAVGAKARQPTETVLYNFTGGSDGGGPNSRLTSDGAGNFYGTTQYGGASGQGTVFELSPNGRGGWNEAVLYSLCSAPSCTDGADPVDSPVIFDSAGNLYGTASGGGAYGNGVVFELSPVGTSWTETVLHSFGGGADGANPDAGVIMDPVGNLYGTTSVDGGVDGTVFELSPSGGGWTEQVIYTAGSPSGLTMDAAGNIFGTTYWAVFELSPNANGGWNPAVIYTFVCTREGQKCPYGRLPWGTLVLDRAGNLYGVTAYGDATNYGEVYKLSPGSGTWTEVILHRFKGSPKDGGGPFAGIVFDNKGNIYGTTSSGGEYGAPGGGWGTVYELVVPIGTHKNYEEKVLWNFNWSDGGGPFSSLILDSGGNLYGTTSGGGSGYGYGVVFEVTPVGCSSTHAP